MLISQFIYIFCTKNRVRTRQLTESDRQKKGFLTPPFIFRIFAPNRIPSGFLLEPVDRQRMR